MKVRQELSLSSNICNDIFFSTLYSDCFVESDKGASGITWDDGSVPYRVFIFQLIGQNEFGSEY